MSALSDLIEKIDDADLRSRIQLEVNRLHKQKKFGLVFEDHMPEACRLPEVPIRVGSRVARKTDSPSSSYFVKSICDGVATCSDYEQKTTIEVPLNELVCVALFGEPIYPYLKMLDKVQNAPDLDLWHALIEADNYHALQLLAYLYPGKVDCIYIDPPYNSGARDWKYNNDYVDSNDQYRHSKWLSMMKRRLELAKILLNPTDSVLIVTIDEKEYLHLGCLLEEMFPEARIQMVSTLINPKGVVRGGFRRADEYIYFVMFGTAVPQRIQLDSEWSPSSVKSSKSATSKTPPEWTSMMRRGSHSSRRERPGLYYAIFANPNSKTIERIGEPIPIGLHSDVEVEGLIQILPLRTDGSEGCWQVGPTELRSRIEQGRIRLGKPTSYGYVVNYLPDGAYKDVLSDKYVIEGRAQDGSLIAFRSDSDNEGDDMIAPTQWKISSHNASEHGTTLLNKIIGKRFSFPKSLYAVRDTIRFFVANKPNALIVDFFAGSGTTLHAVNLLNAEDNGHRRCIMVTNNEVSEDEAKDLRKRGYQPGDEEWEKLGIARYVNWPRTVCSIEGHDVKGNSLKGNYIGSDAPMADGFPSNCTFFQLGFLDKTSVALGRQFRDLLPLLWMKAGAINSCPELSSDSIPDILIYPENQFAVLTEESSFCQFEQQITELGGIDTVYIVTDSESSYREMVRMLKCKHSYQLYRDYLDNFRINKAR